MINLFDPKYKIVADNGKTDNSAGLQAAADDVCASNGTLYIPPVSDYIGFKSAVSFKPQNGATFATIRVIAEGNAGRKNFTQFAFTGPGTSAFTYTGLRGSIISGVGVLLGYAPMVRDCIAHEVQSSAQFNDAGNLTFDNISVLFNGCKNCTGFRVGQDTSGRSNSPWLTLRNCCFTDSNSGNGDIGVHIGGSQAYGVLLEQCSGAQLAQYVLNGAVSTALTAAAKPGDSSLAVADASLLTSVGTVKAAGVLLPYTGKTGATLTGLAVSQALPAGACVQQYVAGQGVYPGSGLITVLKGGGSGNLCDFWQLTNCGTLHLSGTRFEAGKRLYQDVAVIPTGFISHLEVDGGYLASYSGTPVYVRGSGTLGFRGWSVYGNATPWTAGNPLIAFDAPRNHGALSMDRCDVFGTDPFYSNPQAFPVGLRNVQLTDGGHAIALLNRLENGAV